MVFAAVRRVTARVNPAPILSLVAGVPNPPYTFDAPRGHNRRRAG